MSMFNWFFKKPSAAGHTVPESSGLGHIDATVPFHHAEKGSAKMPVAPKPGSAANRRGERLERRELLYTVVRESMTSAGVLSSGYKFKVLSLDSRGVQYLIMMDLASDYAAESARLAELENLIAHNAKSRFGILVTSVYWRVNEQVTAGQSRASAPTSMPAPLSPAVTPVKSPIPPLYEPLEPDEMAAFKKALASVPVPTTRSAPGEILRSGRRNPAPPPDFQSTEIDDRASPLSGTQYGELR
jgi:hypothetical protein